MPIIQAVVPISKALSEQHFQCIVEQYAHMHEVIKHFLSDLSLTSTSYFPFGFSLQGMPTIDHKITFINQT